VLHGMRSRVLRAGPVAAGGAGSDGDDPTALIRFFAFLFSGRV